jgi:hypothetical protein
MSGPNGVLALTHAGFHVCGPFSLYQRINVLDAALEDLLAAISLLST